MTQNAGPQDGILCATAKKKTNAELWTVDKGSCIFLTQVKPLAHLLILSVGGGIIGIARQLSTMDLPRGQVQVAVHGMPGAAELGPNVERAHAWGPGCSEAACSTPLQKEWLAWAGARGFRMGAVRPGKETTPPPPLISLTAAIIAVLLNRVQFHRDDPVVNELAQMTPPAPGGTAFLTHLVAEGLLRAWAAQPHRLPDCLTQAMRDGTCLAILNIADGRRSGVAMCMPAVLFPPGAPASPCTLR